MVVSVLVLEHRGELVDPGPDVAELVRQHQPESILHGTIRGDQGDFAR